MPNGFTTTANCQALAPQIQAGGFDFVCRYYGHDLSKCLTLAEAQALSANGVKLVTIWEDNPTSDSYFSHASGVNDASSAYHFALKIGQAAGSALYFAVDYDASAEAVNGPITDYFNGISAGMSAMEANGGAPQFQVGVYGSGLVCQTLLGLNLVDFAWLAYAPHWSNAGFGGANINQQPTATLLGVGVDMETATPNYGGF